MGRPRLRRAPPVHNRANDLPRRARGQPIAHLRPTRCAARSPRCSRKSAFRRGGPWVGRRQSSSSGYSGARLTRPSRCSRVERFGHRKALGREALVGPRRYKTLRVTGSRSRSGFRAKRLKGFEPSTFCMASRTWDPERPRKVLEKSNFRDIGSRRCFPAFTAKSRAFPD